MTTELKFAYIRDPYNKKRVVTIGWNSSSSKNTICYSLAVNKIVDSDEYELDGRLALFMPSAKFRALQKAMRKRFGSEPHCRRTARSEIAKRLTDRVAWYLQVDKNKPIVQQIMRDFVRHTIPVSDSPIFMCQAYRVFKLLLLNQERARGSRFFKRLSGFFTGRV